MKLDQLVTLSTNHWVREEGNLCYETFNGFPCLFGIAKEITLVKQKKEEGECFEDAVARMLKSSEKDVVSSAENIVNAVSKFRLDLIEHPECVLEWVNYAESSFRKFFEMDRMFLRDVVYINQNFLGEQRISYLFAKLVQALALADELVYWINPLDCKRKAKKGAMGGFAPQEDIPSSIVELTKGIISPAEQSILLNVGGMPSFFVELNCYLPDEQNPLAQKLAQLTGATSEGWMRYIAEHLNQYADIFLQKWMKQEKSWYKLITELSSGDINIAKKVVMLSTANKKLTNLDHVINIIEKVPQFPVGREEDVQTYYCWGSICQTGEIIGLLVNNSPEFVGGAESLNDFEDYLKQLDIPQNYSSLVSRLMVKYFVPKLNKRSAKFYNELLEVIQNDKISHF